MDEKLFNLFGQTYMWFVQARNAISRILSNRLFLVSLLLVGAIWIYYTGYVTEHDSPPTFWDLLKDFYVNVSSGIVGIVITVVLVDTLAIIRQKHNEKEALVLQLASPNNMIAVEALRILRAKGWHRDGTLWHRNLHNANLAGADLRESDFRGSILSGAKLTGADLSAANFTGAELRFVDFKDANIMGTRLLGSDMSDANLEKASLIEVYLDRSSVLPDGTTWTSDTIWACFSDSTHPNFWRSNNSRSPAFSIVKDYSSGLET
ncbi:MAG: pentapeptide repeat-containing protein [Anaerolineae bacterium]|nr:pentapeptide repeat-containing protein [Anaerolineae bacterium]